MVCDNNRDESSGGELRPKSAEYPASKLGEIVPEELAHGTVEAVLQQLDRLAIHLFPKARMSPLRNVANHDQKIRNPWTFHSALGCAVANLARYAQTGIPSVHSVLDDLDCVWGAAYTRPIDTTWTSAIETLGHTHVLDVVMRAALARHNIATGLAISVPDLVLLSGGDETFLPRELMPSGAGTVRADVARAWLRMLAVEGFGK